MTFSAGQIARDYKGQTWQVLASILDEGEEFLVLKHPEKGIRNFVPSAAYSLVPPTFQVGRTYKSRNALSTRTFSILFSDEDVAFMKESGGSYTWDFQNGFSQYKEVESSDEEPPF